MAPQPLRTLIIEDNAPLRELNRLYLEGSGRFQVVGQAEDGAEGLVEAIKLRPDVIVLDILMPVMDGWQVLPLLRRTCPSATIVALTMSDQKGGAERARYLGADGYLDKGLSEAEIADRVWDAAQVRTQRGKTAPAVSAQAARAA